MTEFTTREAWLIAAAELLAEPLAAVGEEMVPIRVSVGWPGGRSNRNRTVGQCWSRAASADEINQIFISPLRGEDDTINVLATLLHEMIHAIDDCNGHKGNFARIAKAVGFIPKLTSSDNRSEELNDVLTMVAEHVGLFPSAAITPGGVGGGVAEKPQTTRQLKIVCPEDGYTARTTRKWLDIGLPTCPCGGQMEEA